jgi:hypothetical protein
MFPNFIEWPVPRSALLQNDFTDLRVSMLQ